MPTREGHGTFRAKLGKADKAKRAAELYVKGFTWDEIAKEVGYAHRSNARKAAMEWRDELPAEATEELRRTLIERGQLSYKNGRAAADKLQGEERVDAEAKVGRILKTLGELGGVIKSAPPAVVNVSQSQSTLDVSSIPSEDLPQWRRLFERAKEAKAAASAPNPVDRTP